MTTNICQRVTSFIQELDPNVVKGTILAASVGLSFCAAGIPSALITLTTLGGYFACTKDDPTSPVEPSSFKVGDWVEVFRTGSQSYQTVQIATISLDGNEILFWENNALLAKHKQFFRSIQPSSSLHMDDVKQELRVTKLDGMTRENRTRHGDIPRRLAKAWKRANDQMKAEPKDKGIDFISALASRRNPQQAHPEEFQIGRYKAGVAHLQGHRDAMEDEHLAVEFNVQIGRKSYPVQLFGIFDGHGGNGAAKHVKNNLRDTIVKKLKEMNPEGLTDEGIWNALKLACVDLSKNFKEEASGTTATFSMIIDNKLWTANVGDSRTVLDNGGEPMQLSEDAKPDNPEYEKGIDHRGGIVIENRVNGILAVARGIGDHGVGPGMSARPKITMIPLREIKQGSHLILTCDGVYDVLSTKEVVLTVKSSNKSAGKLAESIVQLAYNKGSRDNISALVVKF